jgi:hypothetical protein
MFAVTVLAGKLRPLTYPLESQQLREPSTTNGLKILKKSKNPNSSKNAFFKAKEVQFYHFKSKGQKKKFLVGG